MSDETMRDHEVRIVRLEDSSERITKAVTAIEDKCNRIADEIARFRTVFIVIATSVITAALIFAYLVGKDIRPVIDMLLKRL